MTTEYYRTRTEIESTYTNALTGSTVTMPGIIISVSTNVMRTDGVIIEAVLGQGNGLDVYSQKLQEEAVREKQLTNALLQAKVEQKQLAVQILTAEDEAQATLFGQLYPPPTPEPPK